MYSLICVLSWPLNMDCSERTYVNTIKVAITYKTFLYVYVLSLSRFHRLRVSNWKTEARLNKNRNSILSECPVLINKTTQEVFSFLPSMYQCYYSLHSLTRKKRFRSLEEKLFLSWLWQITWNWVAIIWFAKSTKKTYTYLENIFAR